MPLEIKIRRARPEDAEDIMRVRREAIYGKAAKHYKPEELADWAQSLAPSSIKKQKEYLSENDGYTYVAEYKGKIIGFSTIIPARNELGRLYAAPGKWRGLGGRLLKKAEMEARKFGLTYLVCDSSLNAENFYRRHGFEVIEKTTHHMTNGREVRCVKMKKQLKEA